MDTFYIITAFICLSSAPILIEAVPDERRLIADLTSSTDVDTRPVANVSETVVVKVGLALIRLENIDEKEGTMNTNVWFRHLWKDMTLRWNPEDYGGIDHLRIPAKKIWRPDLIVYNARSEVEMSDTLAVVSSDGTVLYIPRGRMRTHCSLDITYFPMDTQHCTIKIGSWTYDGWKIDVQFYDGLESVDVTDYIENIEWRLIEHPARLNTKYYPCCKEPYPDLTFTLVFRRHNTYYTCVYIAPAVLLALLAPFIFLLPPADNQKMMLGIGLLLSFTIFFQSVGQILPFAHSIVPLIDKYYLVQYTFIVLSIMVSTFVANIARRSIVLRQPPSFVKQVMLSCLGKCLCVSNNMYSDLPSSENLKTELMEQAGTSHAADAGRREWLLIATVLDRLFFLISLITTIIITIFMLTAFPTS